MSLSLIAYENITQSQTLYARDFVDDLTDKHEGYAHTISAVGGYDSASFTIRGTKDYLQDWFDDGIMRRIVLYNPESIPIWEGFVNRLRFTAGTKQETKTIENMYDKIYLKYSPLITNVSPPIEQPPVTLLFDDIDSQIKYGIKAVTLSGGGRTDRSAFDWGRTVLENRSEIATGESVNITATESYSLQVECLGYWHTLKWIPYISTATGEIQSHQVIQEVLRYFNGLNSNWINQDFGLMDYNFSLSRRGYDDLPSCADVIEEIIKNGGAGSERWVGGVYQYRQFVYKPAEEISGLYSDEIQLFRSLEDPGQLIYDTGMGTEVKPWDMTPDKILHTIDVNTGGSQHLKYIEQITYTEPYGLTLVGEDDERLSVWLARRGLPTI